MNNSAKTDSGQKYYLVDFSSVKENSFDGIENLTENDNLIVFFIRGESAVDFSLLSKFNSCPANVTMKEVGTKELILPVISMYIGSISNETPDIYLVCKEADNYLKTAEIAIGNEINIKVQQNISGEVCRVSEPVRYSDAGIRRVSESEKTVIQAVNIYKRS